MIIDAHVHLGRNKHIDATPTELVRSMDKAGIDKSLVFAGRIGDAPNEWMLLQISKYPDRLLGVASAHPLIKLSNNHTNWDLHMAEAKQIVQLYEENKIVACKFYTGYDHYYPSDPVARCYLRIFAEAGLPVIFHCGDCLNTACGAKLKYAHPLLIDEVAVDYPSINFIIAHMGFPWHRDAAEVCYKNRNVYSDISGFVYGDFQLNDIWKFKQVIREFLEIAPSNKLLFGTDWPISNQSSYLHALDTGFGEILTAQSLTENAQKAFKL